MVPHILDIWERLYSRANAPSKKINAAAARYPRGARRIWAKTGGRAAPEFRKLRSSRPSLPMSLRHWAECQAGAKSADESVCCEGRAVGSGTALPAAAFTGEPLSWEPRRSVRYS
jgi:hypothetical protein